MFTPSVSHQMSFRNPAGLKMRGLIHDAPAAKSAAILPSNPTPLSSGVADSDAKTPNPSRVDHFREGLKNLLYVPILPAIGYLGLDATGVTSAIAGDSPALKMILGEGFGHAGLCFSLHFVLNAGYHFWKTIRG